VDPLIYNPSSPLGARVRALETNQADLYNALSGSVVSAAQSAGSPVGASQTDTEAIISGLGVLEANTPKLPYGVFASAIADDPRIAALIGGVAWLTNAGVKIWTYGGANASFNDGSGNWVDVTGAAGVLNYTAGASQQTVLVLGLCANISEAGLMTASPGYPTPPPAGAAIFVRLASTNVGVVTTAINHVAALGYSSDSPVVIPEVYTLAAAASISVGFQMMDNMSGLSTPYNGYFRLKSVGQNGTVFNLPMLIALVWPT
jgi:hypothetical protein